MDSQSPAFLTTMQSLWFAESIEVQLGGKGTRSASKRNDHVSSSPTQFRLQRPAAIVLLAHLFASSTSVTAQVVRGTVTERGTGEPLPGVLITLESTGGEQRTSRALLTDGAGQYLVRGSPGAYRLSAKRIGVQRFVSDSFRLATGETRQVDILLERLAFQLPEVRIVENGLCVTREAERQRVSALWDEARTALTANSLSRRDRLFQGSITRYSRHLDPRSLRVLADSWSELTGTYDRAFVSPSGDSLSRFGYWRMDGADATYYAPDGDVLLSRAFQRDHCFHVVASRPDRPAMVGLGFTPLPTRSIPDVRGVLWMDNRTFALQLVEFAYTQLPGGVFADRVGGELRFSRLKSGAWVTSRWMLRMPQYIGGNIRELIEEGGMAFGPDLRLSGTPAAIAGTLTDSSGRPFAGADIRVAGTPFATVTDGRGAFRLDSLPAGYFTLIATHPSYEALGALAGQQGLALREGQAERVALRAQNTAELVERICPGQRLRRDRVVLRVTAVDSATSRPLANMQVWLRWVGGFVGSGEGLMARTSGEEQRTDQNGGAAFCGVPANTPLSLSAVDALGRPARDSIIVRATGGGITAVQLRTRRP